MDGCQLRSPDHHVVLSLLCRAWATPANSTLTKEGWPTEGAGAEPGPSKADVTSKAKVQSPARSPESSLGTVGTEKNSTGFQHVSGQCRDRMERDLSQGPTMGSGITGSLQQLLRLAGQRAGVSRLPKVTPLGMEELVFEPTDLRGCKAV